jgi:hypothetical protein
MRCAVQRALPSLLPGNAPSIKLRRVKGFICYLLLVFGTASGCGDANSGATGTGGSDGTPPAEQSAYGLSCTIDTLVLEIPIELTYLLDRPLVAGAKADLSFSATVIFDEAFSAALIDAGVSKVDIMAMDISSSVPGATPSTLETSLAVGINDFDLNIDTDDNGAPGPHRLELDNVTTTVSLDEDTIEVELGLSLDMLSFVLGDFDVPTECESPTLVGFSASFPVAPPR